MEPNRPWTVLVTGLCSVGKSSFVGALWGDSEMLPTAVRDCTQTNTLIRAPRPDEPDRRILLRYLPRERALLFMTQGLACYRLSGLISDALGLAAPKLAEMPPDARLCETARAVRKIFAESEALRVLHEPLTDDLEQLEDFLAFIDSPAYSPGQAVPADWSQRREHLMGRRRPDGYLMDTGRLMSLEHVELVRASPHWVEPEVVGTLSPNIGTKSPGHYQIIDSPWVPAYHNLRRTELILAQARKADMLVILTLPERYAPEDWVLKIWRERPELLKRTLIVYNQIDTVDTGALFAREGFAQVYEANRERLAKLGLDPDNTSMSCARLPFLQNLPPDEGVAQRIERLAGVLRKIAAQAEGRARGDFAGKLRAACDPRDAGIGSLRRMMWELQAKTRGL